jgi:MrcB-like, N-terminal domain
MRSAAAFWSLSKRPRGPACRSQRLRPRRALWSSPGTRVALRDLTDQSAVLAAIAEADRIGEAAFLEKYGFQPSRRFRIAHDGATYPSKALLAAAHSFQFPDAGPLRPGDFSGGRDTVAKAQALGFTVVEVDGRTDELGVALARFMRLFLEARGADFSHDHPGFEALTACATLIERMLPAELTGAEVRPSVGRGNWASVPWIAVLHPSVTNSTQHGVYPVLLFREDMQAVEVTIAQGVTDFKASLGRRQAVQELHRRAEIVRGHLQDLEAAGFVADSAYELGPSQLGRDYVESTVVHRSFEIDDLAESDVTENASALLRAYGSLLVNGRLSFDAPPAATPSPRALMIYVGRGANTNFEIGGTDGWWGWKDAPTGLEALRPGDLIAFGRGFSGGSPRVDAVAWQLHRLREVVVGRVITTPERTDHLVMPDEIAGEASYPWKLRFERLGSASDVPLEPGDRLSVAAAEGLRRSAIARGIGVLVPVAGSPLLEAYMDSDTSPVAMSPTAVAALGHAFVDAVETAGLRFRSNDVIAFVAAMLAKPFAILTGQSGSGKTQLAKRLGEWFGADHRGRPRYLSVPVRPDWTGPEYLFGYPDALRSSAEAEVWAVPGPLEFMLRAAAEPEAPYLLLLDEMNLAHVERYFADFLSGVESGDPVLPELRREDGHWVAAGSAQRLPLPRNLFVVGTVNVDETTYLFSPKVLDRAFTFEFRTAADELDPSLRRPSPTGPAGADTTRLFAQVAADDNWHHEHPHSQRDALVADLQELHGLLSASGHDFGHRVFYESLRYAAILGAMGVADRWDVMDRILLMKLLPKMHGTRSRVDQPLRALRQFARGPEDDQAPRMPLSAAKLARMLEVLAEAQFVSFTE